MAEFEQHLTNEQLSALLDGQLSESEQEYADKHLPTCEQCRQQQAELRQMVVLLHALPQPAHPRSFALPLDFTLTEATVIPIKAERPLRNRSGQSSLPSYVRSTMRAVSALAAVVGIVFLLTSIFPPSSYQTMHLASTASSGAASIPAPAAPSTGNTPNNDSLTQAAMSPRAASSGTPQKGTLLATPTTPPEKLQQSKPGLIPIDPPLAPATSPFGLDTSLDRAILGFLLLVLGVLGVTLFRRRKHSIKTNKMP